MSVFFLNWNRALLLTFIDYAEHEESLELKQGERGKIGQNANKNYCPSVKLKKKATFESVFNSHAETMDRTQNMSTEQKAWYYEKLLRNILIREENDDRKIWPRRSSDILATLTKRKVQMQCCK